jgi:hypothetical protein
MPDATAADVLAGRSLWSVQQGDVLDFLNRLPADSVDLLVTSPPYDDCRTYSVGFSLKGEAWAEWMTDVVRAALRVCKGPVVVVCQGKTDDFAWTGSPVLLMANLLRAGVTLRRPVIYRRDSIPGSGGEDYLRMSWEFAVVATRGGKLPWADSTATGHPPKWGPGGEMSNRLSNGTRVNQWGNKMANPGGRRKPDGKVQRYDTPSHVETVIGPADDAPCLPMPGLEAPPPKPVQTGLHHGGNVRSSDGSRKATKASTHRRSDGERRDETFTPPVLANPGDVVSHLYTQAEVDALLAAYQGSDVVDCGAVGGGRMGHKLAHANEAPFPEDLARFFILTFCPPGGVVCDPFAGSGTTGAVAVAEGRRAILSDLRGPEQPDPKHDMVTLSRRRLAGVVPPLPVQADPAPEAFPQPEPAPPEPCLPGLEGLLKPAPEPYRNAHGVTTTTTRKRQGSGKLENIAGSEEARGKRRNRKPTPAPEEPDHA